MINPNTWPIGILVSTVFFASLTGLTISLAQDSAHPVLSSARLFEEKSGEELYNNVCKACHMGNGKGATGAATYPSLEKNENLETSAYPVYIVTHGQKGMPPVGRMMSDEQVAAVINYVRTHFGNDYNDALTAADVTDQR